MTDPVLWPVFLILGSGGLILALSLLAIGGWPPVFRRRAGALRLQPPAPGEDQQAALAAQLTTLAASLAATQVPPSD